MYMSSKSVENLESYAYLKKKWLSWAPPLLWVCDVICSLLNMHKLNNSHMQKHQMLPFCICLLWYNNNLFSIKLHCLLSNRKFYSHFRNFQSLIKYSQLTAPLLTITKAQNSNNFLISWWSLIKLIPKCSVCKYVEHQTYFIFCECFLAMCVHHYCLLLLWHTIFILRIRTDRPEQTV